MPYASLDTQEIVRLYVEEELPVRAIATHFGCSYSRIYNVLRSRVIMRRSRRMRTTMEYARVAAIMRERIVTGDWKPEHKILSQDDLSKIFAVSVQTVREAISHLRQHGYLRTVPNRGTYVRPRQDWPPHPNKSPTP